MLDPNILSVQVTGLVDDTNSELAQHLDTGATALINCPLQQWHKKGLGQEDHESCERIHGSR